VHKKVSGGHLDFLQYRVTFENFFFSSSQFSLVLFLIICCALLSGKSCEFVSSCPLRPLPKSGPKGLPCREYHPVIKLPMRYIFAFQKVAGTGN